MNAFQLKNAMLDCINRQRLGEGGRFILEKFTPEQLSIVEHFIESFDCGGNLADLFNERLADEVDGGPVPFVRCLELAGTIENPVFRPFREHGESWIEITFSDGSSVVLSMED